MTRDDITIRRRRRGWSQTDLARRVGVERTYISKIERGHRRAGKKLLERIKNALAEPDLSIRCSMP